MGRNLLGTNVLRREDRTLVTGVGRYVADIEVPDRAEAVFVRSTVPSGTITSVDVRAAASMPGVLGAYTGHDLPANNVDQRFPMPPEFAREALSTLRPPAPAVLAASEHEP